jgi:hypothetical protein
MNRFAVPTAVAAVLVIGISRVPAAQAVDESAQPWSGYVEYTAEWSDSSQSDSTWGHATAINTPTSHKTINLSVSRTATFMLTRDDPRIPVDVTYAQHAMEDVESRAEIWCRTPSGRFNTSLSRNYSSRVDSTGAGRVPKGEVTVGIDNKTGEYTITAAVGEFDGVTATATTNIRENSGCPSKPRARPQDPPPSRTSIAGFSVKGKGVARIEPGQPIVLSGSAPVGKYETLTWNLSAEPDDPPVAIHGPYETVRGGQVTFDGSRSKGKNLKYAWTFKAGDCSEGGSVREVKREGPVVTAALLCNTEVTLEVSDGKRSNKKTRTAKVRPREWKTELVRGSKRYFDDPTHMLSVDKVLHFFPGANRCEKHGDVNGGDHYLHPDRPWEGVLYRVKQVGDGGPFDGMTYVDLMQNPLQVARGIWLNNDLKPTSRMAQANAKVKERARDFQTLVLQAEAHEQMHTTLIEEAMRRRDYAPELEMLVGNDRDSLKTQADIKLGEARNAIEAAALDHAELKARLKRDPKFNRPGTILVPCGADGDTETFCDWQIPNFAELGDD